MVFSLVSARDAAVSFAGAFVCAMLFVSAAVGPLLIALTAVNRRFFQEWFLL